jgi:hypothetical protein
MMRSQDTGGKTPLFADFTAIWGQGKGKARSAGGAGQCLIQIGNDIVGVLNPD